MDILVIEDDPQVRSLLCRTLGQDDVAVGSAGTCVEARQVIRISSPRLVLLDLGLPGGDGMDLGRWIKVNHPSVGIIIVTGRAEVSDRVAGLDSGADDYIAKPFELDELRARVRSLLRRLAGSEPISRPQPRQERIGDWQLDEDLCCLARQDQRVGLTLTELRLLQALMERPNRTATRQWLLDRVLASEETGERVIDYHVHSLRTKLRQCRLSDGIIQSVRGIGYVYSPPGNA